MVGNYTSVRYDGACITTKWLLTTCIEDSFYIYTNHTRALYTKPIVLLPVQCSPCTITNDTITHHSVITDHTLLHYYIIHYQRVFQNMISFVCQFVSFKRILRCQIKLMALSNSLFCRVLKSKQELYFKGRVGLDIHRIKKMYDVCFFLFPLSCNIASYSFK